MSPQRGDAEFYDPQTDVIYLGTMADTNPAAAAKLDRLLRSAELLERRRSRDWPPWDEQKGPDSDVKRQ